jgi:uncharacterized protein YggE
MARQIDTGLIVRPDMLVMEVGIEKRDRDPTRALTQAQAEATDLLGRLQQATGGAATLRPCGTRVTPVGGQAKVEDPATVFAVSVEGRIEIGLAPEADYWRRSSVVAALAQLADGYAASSATKQGARGVSLGHTRVVVRDPEAFRAKLTEQWVQRARAFAAAAQAQAAPLYAIDCSPPGDIAQKELSLEEVALSLGMSCRLGSPEARPAPALH